MTDTRIAKSLCLHGIAVLVAAMMLACAFALPAYANKVLESPISVADDITRLHVNKLDADTHEAVIGATMVIEDESGNVVAEWVSDGTTFKIEKGLDVDVMYTLRELSAPEGYGTISPITFTVDPIEGNGITINSGDESQYDYMTSFSSLAEGVQCQLNLYDKMNAIEVETVVETKPAPAGGTTTSTTVAPKTGDETPMTTVALLVGAGIVAILLLQLPKRRMED